MKVYVLVSGTAQPGKYREARKAVTETIEYLNANIDYVGEYDAVRPRSGPNSQICWMCRYRSLAEYEQESERRANDPEWSGIFESVRQAVDLDGITAQIFQVLDA
jgi:hypothetical protein